MQDIAFQMRPGSPELSCCSVNAPRGLGMLSSWAAMSAEDGIALNYYGPSEFILKTPSGGQARITQMTDYPISGQVSVGIESDTAACVAGTACAGTRI